MTTPDQVVTTPLPERIAALKEEDRRLQHALFEESERPFPQLSTVNDLNKRTVQIRDEIAELQRQCNPAYLSWRGDGSVNMTGKPRVRTRGQQHRRP